MNIRLVVVKGGKPGKTFFFSPGEYYIGRGAECHIRPNSDLVSRQHCSLRITRSLAHLRDLGSRHGTLVNGKLVMNEVPLRHGDLIQVYPLVFEVQVDDMTPMPGSLAFIPEVIEPSRDHAR